MYNCEIYGFTYGTCGCLNKINIENEQQKSSCDVRILVRNDVRNVIESTHIFFIHVELNLMSIEIWYQIVSKSNRYN